MTISWTTNHQCWWFFSILVSGWLRWTRLDHSSRLLNGDHAASLPLRAIGKASFANAVKPSGTLSPKFVAANFIVQTMVWFVMLVGWMVGLMSVDVDSLPSYNAHPSWFCPPYCWSLTKIDRWVTLSTHHSLWLTIISQHWPLSAIINYLMSSLLHHEASLPSYHHEFMKTVPIISINLWF